MISFTLNPFINAFCVSATISFTDTLINKERSLLNNALHVLTGKGLGGRRVCLPTWLGGRYPSVGVRKHTRCGVFACMHAVSLMELGGCRLFSPHRPTAS